VAPGCIKVGDCARGFCGAHYNLWRKLSDDQRAALMKFDPPHWEYEPTPEQVAELIEQHGDEQK
jgi:hypothetical protein